MKRIKRINELLISKKKRSSDNDNAIIDSDII